MGSWLLVKAIVVAVVTVGIVGSAGAVARAQSTPPAQFSLMATVGASRGAITGENQEFSVESADFAHGFLTDARLGDWLKTLGPDGRLRLGGYSMDLVWPAFGQWSDTPTPDWAIGGTVDQSDLDALKTLLDDTGWNVTLGAPLLSVINGQVSMDQMVAEVLAARATLGEHLLYVEVGNEYDHVTTLTPADYWATMKRYQAAIAAAAPDVPIKLAGPSASTNATTTRLEDFVTAALADTTQPPQALLGEVTSHWYAGSHCGKNTTSIEALVSPATHMATAANLQALLSITDRLPGGLPTSINESNSASCSGQAGVSNAYASALWSLDYLMQTAQSGVRALAFHTSTAALCGDLKARNSPLYPISYRFYAAFCAPDQDALDANRLAAAPLYYGIWTFRQVPPGRFLDVDLPDSALAQLRAYAIQHDDDSTTAVLINVQDPAAPASTSDLVSLRLPSRYRHGSAIVLQSAAPGGLGSTDAAAITLGGRSMTLTGVPTGEPRPRWVRVLRRRAMINVAPGTAQVVTFWH